MWTCFVWFSTNKCQLSSNYTIQLKLKYCDSMSSWSFVILADLNWSSQGNFIIAKLSWNHLKEQYNENRLTEIWAHVALFLAEGRDAEQHDHSAPLTLSSWLYRDLPFHNNGDHNFSSKSYYIFKLFLISRRYSTRK